MDKAKRNAEICRRYKNGESAAQIAPHFDLSPDTVVYVLERHCVPRRHGAAAQTEAGKKAKAQYWARLRTQFGANLPSRVVRCYRAGKSQRQVATTLGISLGMVQRILIEKSEARRTYNEANKIRWAA